MPISGNLKRWLFKVSYVLGDFSSYGSSAFRLLALSACKGWKCWRARVIWVEEQYLSVCLWKIKRPTVHAASTTVMSTSVRPCERERILIDTGPPSRRRLRPDPSRPAKMSPGVLHFPHHWPIPRPFPLLGTLFTVIIINLITFSVEIIHLYYGK